MVLARRRWNKFLGRPSTAEVEIVATVIEKLRSAVDEELESGSMNKVLLTVPYLPGLYYEDLEDAMEYTGLTMLSSHKHIGSMVPEVGAAFAGSGYGLCQHYDDLDVCEDEEADMPFYEILALSLSQVSFSAAYTYMQAAYGTVLEKQITCFDLGLHNLPPNREDSQALY